MRSEWSIKKLSDLAEFNPKESLSKGTIYQLKKRVECFYECYLHMIYDYDYKQKSNLFGLDLLYRKIPKKSFIKGKKQEIEAVLLYQYCHDWEEAEQYWEEYQEKIL